MSIFVPTTTQSGGGYRYVLECDSMEEASGGSYSTTASYGGVLFVCKQDETGAIQTITVDGHYKPSALYAYSALSGYMNPFMAYTIPFGKSITITFNSNYSVAIMVYRYHRYPET